VGPPAIRSLLVRGAPTALALLACAALAGCPAALRSVAPPALAGAWRGRVQFSGGVLAPIQDLEFLYVFNAGGTMTESSNYDGVPPVPPAYGEWRPAAGGRFEARYTFFTTRPPADLKTITSGGGWLPAGSGVLTEHIALATDGRSYDSHLSLELFDPAGKPAPGGGEGSVHATRAGF
jgi:hypothetical protein